MPHKKERTQREKMIKSDNHSASSWGVVVLALALFNTILAIPNWDVNLIDFTADISPDSTDELLMKYEIASNRAYSTELLAVDCTSDTTGITITRSTPVRTLKGDDHDDLIVGYSFDKSNLTYSNIWNATSNQIEFCHILRLNEIPPADSGLETMVITEVKQTFFTAVDDTVDFALNDIALQYTGPTIQVTFEANLTISNSTPQEIEGIIPVFEETIWETAWLGFTTTGAEVTNVTVLDVQEANATNGIDDTRVEYEVVLEERCANFTDCTALMNETTIYDDVTSYLAQEIGNGNFIATLRAKAEEFSSTQRHLSLPAAKEEYEESDASDWVVEEKYKSDAISNSDSNHHHDQRKLTLAYASSEFGEPEFGEPVMEIQGLQTFNQVYATADVVSYVEACKCDGAQPFTCNTEEPLLQNQELNVCIWSVSSDVEVDYLDSMYITQDTENLGVIENGQISFSAITSRDYVPLENGVAVSTRVPSNTFDYTSDGSSVTISGVVVMKLAGGRRRKLVMVANSDAPGGVEEMSPFRLSVELASQKKDELIEGLNSGATGAAVANAWWGIAMLGLILSCII